MLNGSEEADEAEEPLLLLAAEGCSQKRVKEVIQSEICEKMTIALRIEQQDQVADSAEDAKK